MYDILANWVDESKKEKVHSAKLNRYKITWKKQITSA